MASEVVIRARAEAAGYRVAGSLRLPREAHDAYYIPLEARVAKLAECADVAVASALENLRNEIDVVRRFRDEAGYTFFTLQRAAG